MADDTEDAELDFTGDEQERARRSTAGDVYHHVVARVVCLLCDYISRTFASCFVLIITQLCFDFWSVKGTNTRTEAWIFWLGLIVCPLIWTVFFFTTLFSLKIKWLSLVVPSISLHMATLYRFPRCKAVGHDGQTPVCCSVLTSSLG